ncbi:MAG: flagellar assembly protein FliH [Treponema sp.]|jgi:flagellar assembly protein FliH|nr:flagellar assembly protein FliH [Treponema sp.]
MAKAVFRPGELTELNEKVVIETPTSFPDLAHLAPEEEEIETEEPVEEYLGPTAEDLRREAEAFKFQWDTEREAMIQNAKDEAERIVKEAEEAASGTLQQKHEEAEKLKTEAQEEAEKIITGAKLQIQELEAESHKTFEAGRKEAEEQGREAGREAGFASGKAEVERLIQRTQIVLERAQDKRAEILAETEQEIIDLVLLISRKVVKVISENQRNVIVSNVIQALRKVRDRGNIIIRVNIADVKLATEHTKDFIQMLEGVKSIQVVEDSSVDSGGCIIETDFGEIDARIASQLAELEAKILEISPIKSKIRQSPAGTANGVPSNGAARAALAARAAAATKAVSAAAETAAAPAAAVSEAQNE